MALIEIEQLTKSFGPVRAVDHISFRVDAGEVIGFLGPNGAGKSTTMKMVTGFLAPTSGTARVCGFDVRTSTLPAQRCMGYLPEGAPAYPDMTPAGFLQFCARARGLTGDAGAKAIAQAVARTNLEGVLAQPVETLSKGFKRRVGLAQAILHEPRVLIMDEPTDGLDPNQKHEVRQLIKSMAEGGQGKSPDAGKAVILSTHILEEVEAVCTRAIVISKGRIVADCTPAELIGRSRHHGAVTLRVAAPAHARVREELLTLAGVRSVEEEHGAWTIFPKETARESVTPLALQLCATRGWRVEGVRTEQGRLDEVFRELTGGARS